MAAIEFVKDRQSREPYPEFRNKVVQHCFQRGLLVLGCGESAIRFCPALTVSEQQISTAIDIVRSSILSVHHKNRGAKAA